MTDTLIHGLYREGEKIADAKAPHDVPIAQRWEQRKFTAALVNPANRRKLDIIVVGSGPARGARAAGAAAGGGWAAVPMAIVIFVLAFSSIIAAATYSEVSMTFISERPEGRWLPRLVSVSSLAPASPSAGTSPDSAPTTGYNPLFFTTKVSFPWSSRISATRIIPGEATPSPRLQHFNNEQPRLATSDLRAQPYEDSDLL